MLALFICPLHFGLKKTAVQHLGGAYRRRQGPTGVQQNEPHVEDAAL